MKNVNIRYAAGPGRQAIIKRSAPWTADQLDYALFCANLWHFSPQISPETYPQLYDSILTLQQTPGDGQLAAGDTTTGRSALRTTLAMLRQAPGIICTYHTGAYRQICRTLAQEGIPYTLAVSADVLKREGQMLRHDYNNLGSPAGPAGFRLLDAESPGVIRSLCNDLSTGRNLLLYVDGNTGSACGKSRNLMTLPFLNGEIQVRKGLASLSYLAKKPLYPVLIGRAVSEHLTTPVCTSINPVAGEARDAYEKRATALLYRILESYVSHYPEDWECWRYLHHWLPADRGKYPSGIHALQKYGASGRWHPVVHQGCHYLLDRFTYQLYPVHKDQRISG